MNWAGFRLLAIPLACAILLTMTSGCAVLVYTATPHPGPTVTINPHATPSSTPFQPLAIALLPSLTPTIPFTLTPSPPPANLPTSTATPSKAGILPKYTLNVSLDYNAHSLSVDEVISYPNTSLVLLSALVLSVEADRWSGCFVLKDFEADGQQVKDYKLNWIRLDAPLVAPLAPGQTVTLTLRYDLHLPGANIYRIFGYNARQLDLGDWYPFVVPYIPGQGWLLHDPADIGEHLVYDLANFDVTIRLADPSLPVTIAASGPCDRKLEGWHCTLEHARTFAISASTGYQSSTAQAGDVIVTSFFFRGEDKAGEAVLQAVVKAIATYSKYFGAYPYPALSIVEAFFYDGKEYSGLFFLSRNFYASYDGTVLNYLIDIGVHETAHQWFFSLVGNDQALEPWLDEALATYSENIFYQANYPAVNGWWYLRVDIYKPAGWVDTDIYHAGSFRSYTNAVYLRGAQFLQALRDRMGDVDFFAFLKDYAAQMAGKRATAVDFFYILREHTSAKVADIVNQYFQVPH